jgi:hypothetical protein
MIILQPWLDFLFGEFPRPVVGLEVVSKRNELVFNGSFVGLVVIFGADFALLTLDFDSRLFRKRLVNHGFKFNLFLLTRLWVLKTKPQVVNIPTVHNNHIFELSVRSEKPIDSDREVLHVVLGSLSVQSMHRVRTAANSSRLLCPEYLNDSFDFSRSWLDWVQ